MRRRLSLGLALRALLAASINAAVLLAGVGFVVAWAALILLLAPADPGERSVRLGALGIAAVVAVPACGWAVVRTIAAERRRLLDGTVAAHESDADEADSVETRVRRLAAQFDLVEPEVRIRPTAVPLAYSTYRPTDPIVRTARARPPVVVVSTGLLHALPATEVEAVLAHELAHLANGDLRLLSWLLVPLVVADVLRDEERRPSTVFGLVGSSLALVGAIGVGVFTRGRELAADRAAASAIGDPGSLAAALERLDATASSRPVTDLRELDASLAAVNVLPPFHTESRSRITATHPPTAVRIERLRRLVAESQ